MTKRDVERMMHLGRALGRMGFEPHGISRLLAIERSLHRSSEARCNVNESEAQEARRDKREGRLELEAQDLARSRGCRCYFQGDPRGCALYVLPGTTAPEGQPDESYYNANGIAVCL